MIHVLWIAPNLNHYKARFLSKLAERSSIRLIVMAGKAPLELGHAIPNEKKSFKQIDVAADRNNFGFNREVYTTITKLACSRSFEIILMPAERKFLPLIIYLRCIRFMGRYRLISYNHPMTASNRLLSAVFNKTIVKSMYALYDRIIFYTEKGQQRAIDQRLIKKENAFFANNTLDTRDIWEHYNFEVNESEEYTLLFIGRIVPYRWIDVLIEYFQELKKQCSNIRLVVIGDGPQSDKIKRIAKVDPKIEWLGSIVDERKIAEEMRRTHLVFVPGHSGLSIVHAFCYGKPYATLSTYSNHPPEIDYLEDGINGMILSGKLESDCARITDLLHNKARYRKMCEAAFSTACELSVDSWCEKMEKALTFSKKYHERHA